MKLAEINIERGKSSEKGIRWALWLYGFMALWLYGFMALWLYGFMALWLYGFMALWGRLKYIFIVSKQRLLQIIQRKKNHIVQINFVGKNYLYATASGNSLRSGADQLICPL